MNDGYITLSQLQTMIKRGIESALPLSYWVVAEVSEIKVNYSGHCYMQLAEKNASSGQSRAVASAVAWRSTYGMIAAQFRAATGGDIAPGMKLLLRVSVSYHELYGLSLVVSQVDPSYTLGDIERERQQTIQRLKEDGTYDMNRQVPLPQPVQRLAVISSRNAAGYGDFMRQLSQSPYRFEVELFDAFMQGDNAEESIIAALEAVAQRLDSFDAVVVIRGGGSQSDLSCFDSYRLCSHLAQFPLPLLTGIGHDKDRSVADMVAAAEFKTPTAVAVFLIEGMAREQEYLASLLDGVLRGATYIIDSRSRLLERLGSDLSMRTSNLTRTQETRLNRYLRELAVGSGRVVASVDKVLGRSQQQLATAAAAILSSNRSRLALAESAVGGHDPQRILALGFAMVRSAGAVLKSPEALKPGDELEITLAGGAIKAVTKEIVYEKG